MALKAVPICVYTNHTHSQLGLSYIVQYNKMIHLLSNCRVNLAKWERFAVNSRFGVEDGRCMSLNLSDLGSSLTDERIDESRIIEFKEFHKDLHSLPKPLSAKDLVAPSNDRAKVRVAYQGSPGAYSEVAALKAYPLCKTVPCDQIESVFKAVELWLVDKGVLLIENSVGGSIHQNYDLLLHHRLHIVGEIELVVNHCLLGLPGVRKGELTHVLSHPQALEQCEIALNKLGIVRVSTQDTAGAAQIVALEGIRETGAIASLRAAEIYRLDVLAQNIQDDADNISRFLILAREPVIPRTDKPHKTSIVFTLEEGPKVLFKALAVFALRDINLLKIESRPQIKRPLRVVGSSNNGRPMYFDYLFYVDFEASMADPLAQYALSHLQKFATFLRVIGCYPINTTL